MGRKEEKEYNHHPSWEKGNDDSPISERMRETGVSGGAADFKIQTHFSFDPAKGGKIRMNPSIFSSFLPRMRKKKRSFSHIGKSVDITKFEIRTHLPYYRSHPGGLRDRPRLSRPGGLRP